MLSGDGFMFCRRCAVSGMFPGAAACSPLCSLAIVAGHARVYAFLFSDVLAGISFIVCRAQLHTTIFSRYSLFYCFLRLTSSVSDALSALLSGLWIIHAFSWLMFQYSCFLLCLPCLCAGTQDRLHIFSLVITLFSLSLSSSYTFVGCGSQ